MFNFAFTFYKINTSIMKILFLTLFSALMILSCGPSAEEIEKQRIQDSIKAEEERLDAIDEANSFIVNPDDTNDLAEKKDSVIN